MPNLHRGEIGAEIGGARRRLVLTLGALAELEAAFGAADLVALAERFGTGRLAARDLVAIIAAGLRGAGEPVTDDDRDQAPGAPPGDAVLPTWPAAIGSQAFPDGVVFSAWHVDPIQDDEELTAGENPTTGFVCDPAGESGDSNTASSSSTTDGDSASDTGDPEPPGCACSSGGGAAPWSMFALGVFALRRRRRMALLVRKAR